MDFLGSIEHQIAWFSKLTFPGLEPILCDLQFRDSIPFQCIEKKSQIFKTMLKEIAIEPIQQPNEHTDTVHHGTNVSWILSN